MITTNEKETEQYIKECKFISFFKKIQKDIYDNAVVHGWWGSKRNDGEVIALMHSELSEALEALRAGNPISEKIPPFSSLEEELADVIIRILDYAENNNFHIAEAIIAKNKYNFSRSYKHGNKKF
jgi:NTP pyrophosphatase (non-canonical NTP hydrolase)